MMAWLNAVETMTSLKDIAAANLAFVEFEINFRSMQSRFKSGTELENSWRQQSARC